MAIPPTRLSAFALALACRHARTPEASELHPAFAALRGWLNQLQRAGDVTLYAANSLWPQNKYPFLKEYLLQTILSHLLPFTV